jgi:Rad3-related DNA helicase
MPEHLITPLRGLAEAYNRVLAGPENQYRRGQVQFAATCHEGIANSRPVVVEGPTGIGKTKALLTVALAHLLTNTETSVLYVTRTIPQLEQVNNDLVQLTTRLAAEVSTNNRLVTFSVYVGVMSLRARYCKEVIDGLVFDEAKLRELRSPYADEYFEPCPDCPVRGSRSVNLVHVGPQQFSLAEVKAQLQKDQCPMPYMREAARNSRIVLATHPYVFDGFWKAANFGNRTTRGCCLPIIDEGHNMIESIIERPCLNIHTADVQEPGMGLDLAANTYHLASLVQNVAFGYRQLIIDHLEPLFGRLRQDHSDSATSLIDEIKALRAQHSELGQRRRDLQEAFRSLTEALPDLRAGRHVCGLDHLPSKESLDRAAALFAEARTLDERRTAIIEQQHDRIDRIKRLRQATAEQKRRRDELQSESKSLVARARTMFGLMRSLSVDNTGAVVGWAGPTSHWCFAATSKGRTSDLRARPWRTRSAASNRSQLQNLSTGLPFKMRVMASVGWSFTQRATRPACCPIVVQLPWAQEGGRGD